MRARRDPLTQGRRDLSGGLLGRHRVDQLCRPFLVPDHEDGDVVETCDEALAALDADPGEVRGRSHRCSPLVVNSQTAEVSQRPASATNSTPPSTGIDHDGIPRRVRTSIFATKAP